MEEYLWEIVCESLALFYGRTSKQLVPQLEMFRAVVPPQFDPREFYKSVEPKMIDFPRRLQRGRNM